jgi:hypothetical protein
MATSKIDEGVDVTVAAVESTTKATPAEADKTSVPNALDAKANQPPVRTNRPDVPIAQVLVEGAGAHNGRVLETRKGYGDIDVEVDADGLDRDGRVVADPKK